MRGIKRFSVLLLVFVIAFNSPAQQLTRQQRINVESLIYMLHRSKDMGQINFIIKKVLSIDSTNLQVIAYRAMANMINNNYGASLKDFNTFMALRPGSAICIYRAKLKIQMGDTTGALRDIENALAFSGYDHVIGNILSGFYDKLGNPRRIEAYYENIIRHYPDNIPAHSVIGRLREQRGDIAGAERTCAQIIKITYNAPFVGRVENRSVYWIKSDLDFKLKRYTEAIEAVTQSILLNPGDPGYYKERIKYYAAVNEQKKACLDMMQVQKMDTTYFPTFHIRCDSTNTQAPVSKEWLNSIEAEKYYLQAYSLKAADTAGMRAAIGYYSKAIALKPDHVQALAARASTCVLTQQYGKAIDDLNRIIYMNPNCGPAFYLRAEAKRALNDRDGAFADQNNAVHSDSTNVEYLLKRAGMKTEFGDTTAALSDLAKALRLNPYSAKAYFERGFLQLYSRKSYTAAVNDFLKAIEILDNTPLEPRNALYYYYCAEAYEKLKMYDKAFEAIEQAIALQPGDKFNYYLCGEIKARMNDMDGACQEWTIAKRLGYADADALLLYNCKTQPASQK